MSTSIATDRDGDLWKVYANKLKGVFLSAGSLSENEGIYVPPLNCLGPRIGTSKHTANTNSQIYNLGDMLLPANSLIFTPGPSYSQRLRRYLDAVQVSGNQNPETFNRLQERNRDLEQASKDFLDCRYRAFIAYNNDHDKLKLTFDEWVAMYHSEYLSDLDQSDAAREAADQASKDYYGHNAGQLNKDKEKVNKALQTEQSFPRYNMAVSSVEAAANVSEKTLEGLTYRPIYEFNGDYGAISQDWKTTAMEHKGENFELTFSASDMDAKQEEDDGISVGFDLVHGDIDPLFRSIRPKDRMGKSVQHPNTKTTQSDVTVTITATEAQVFQISAGDWDLENVVTTYPVLRVDAIGTNLLDPIVQVSQVLLAYQAAIKLQFSSKSTFLAIQDGLESTRLEDGRCKLFGMDIGKADGAEIAHGRIERTATIPIADVETNESCSTITVPFRDSTYSTLLAIKGRRLGAAKVSSLRGRHVSGM